MSYTGIMPTSIFDGRFWRPPWPVFFFFKMMLKVCIESITVMSEEDNSTTGNFETYQTDCRLEQNEAESTCLA